MTQRAYTRRLSWLTALALGVLGCGGSSALQRADVDDLPAGSATGSAVTGEYDMTLLITSCRGSCAVTSGSLRVSLCDVNMRAKASATVMQSNGSLVMDATGLIVDRLTGGIDDGGAFNVGAWGTQNGGSVEARVLCTGTADGTTFSGEAEVRITGSALGQSVECTAHYDVDGTRS